MYLEIQLFLARVFESPANFGLLGASIAFIGYALSRGFKNSPNTRLRPPGPPRHFFIGNLLQFPKKNFYEKFNEWQQIYGDIVSVDLIGVPIVILNSYNIAHNLLDKRPNTTAERKVSYMVQEIMEWGWPLSRIQPGPSHATQRKMLRRGIGPQRVGSHDALVENSSNQLMVKLQGLEGNPYPVVLRALGQFVIDVTYGKMVHSLLPGLTSWNIETTDLANSVVTSIWMVDIFHFLRFVPSWFPGASFQKVGAQAKQLSNQIRNMPYAKARELYRSGKIDHSLATDLLDEFGPNDDARDALGFLYLAGAETTSSAIVAFLHALYLFPEISQKVHDEIIAITEGLRMPQISDRPKMPYTEAVWMESFRWKPWLPIGVPHVNSQDEIVNGYLVKAGTQIFPNNWSMMMDEKQWGDPKNFRPERFLGPDAPSLPNPLTISFGYGMRVCPGLYLADRAGFQVGVATAALYKIVPLEGSGSPNPESVRFTDGRIRQPDGFECRFLPRDQRAEELLKAIRLAG